MISVIMPVYNTEVYLKKSVGDIIKQTYKDWELICVNDGSIDGSLDCLEELSHKDGRIRVISQKNTGPGAARNRGFADAKGDYVVFLDSDDEFHYEFLEVMYNAARTYSADVCICNSEIYSLITNEVFDINDLGENGFAECKYAPWNKLIRRDLIIDNNIRFQNLSSSNDVYFSCITLYKAKTIYCVPNNELVIYKKNREGQISGNREGMNILVAVDALLNEIPQGDLETRRKVISTLISGSIYELRNAVNNDKRILLYKGVRKYLKETLDLYECASERQNRIMKRFLQEPFESEWWKDEKLWHRDLKDNSLEIDRIFREEDRVVLWGCGNRGKAFWDYCQKNKLILYGVADRDIEKAKSIYKSSLYNLKLLNAETAMHESDCIIASNSSVAGYLKSVHYNRKIVNLEKYMIY